MTKHLLALVTALVIYSGTAQAARILHGGTAQARISMDVIELQIESVSSNGTVVLRLHNPSQDPIKIWKESNSWGAALWRVLVIRNGAINVYYQNPNEGFTMNTPSFMEVPGKGQIQKTLDLNAGDWCFRDYCAPYKERGVNGQTITFLPTDTIVVTYDVPFSPEAWTNGVWYGVAAAVQSPAFTSE